jgi:hypothetical protein
MFFSTTPDIITPRWCRHGCEGRVAGSSSISFQLTVHILIRSNDSVLGFLRDDVPKNWKTYCDTVTDNFRIIDPADFRVLKA